MATFTITTANTNIDSLAGKTGGDIYNINGGELKIDQDSRYGVNQNTSSTLGNITISASLGGTLNIDGRDIRIIPYTGGSGTVPAFNTVITNGTGTGKLIGVHANISAQPELVGNSMPATGFIRVKQKSGVYTAGALTGLTATASDAGRVGWLEIVGDEAGTINANRLGVVNITGAWYEVGTTSGVANQTMQIPRHGMNRYIAGVFIQREIPRASTYTRVADIITVTLSGHGFLVGQDVEMEFSTGGAVGNNKTYKIISVIDSNNFTIGLSGSGTSGDCLTGFLEFYGNAGTATTIGTEATRGKVVWVDNTGLVRIGHNGTTTMGYTPISGLKVFIGNIFFENCTTAARTANVIPNATIATRYDFTTTGGGVINIDKCNMAWYLSCSQAYSVNVSNSGFVDAILLSEIATAMTFSKVGVGNKPTTALLVSPLTLTYSFAGGTFTDCVWTRVSMAASGAHTNTINDVDGFTFIRDTIRANTIRGNATTYSINAIRIKNCTRTNPTIIQGAMVFTTCDNVNITDVIYCEAVSGTTVTTYAGYVVIFTGNTINSQVSGVTIPVTNTQPYTALFALSVGCNNNKFRNIGTRVSPLSLGTVNACGLIYTIATGCFNTKFQRIYCSGTRTGIMTGDNSCKGLIEENVFGDYADAVDVMAVLNMERKGMGGTGALTAQTSIYGTHWRDGFISTTVGRIAILMNEATAQTTDQVSLSNGAAFTSAGGLYMPVIGMSATFIMPNYMLGHTGFSNTALVMAGGTAANYTYYYQIDKNDGNGYSALSTGLTPTTLGTALSGITGIDASKGFKLKLTITTSTTNATAITSVYLVTTSTAAAQDYQYPLDLGTINVTGLVSGSRVKATKVSDGSVLFNGSESGGSVSFQTEFIGAIAIEARKASGSPNYIPWVTQVTSVADQSVSAVALQQSDE